MAAGGFQHLTIQRELARNRFRDPDATRDRRRDMSGYHHVNAQDQALACRRRLAKLARHEGLLAHVVDRLAASSLDALAGRLNATPRRYLGHRTPAEVLDGRLDPAACEAAAHPAVLHQRWRAQ